MRNIRLRPVLADQHRLRTAVRHDRRDPRTPRIAIPPTTSFAPARTPIASPWRWPASRPDQIGVTQHQNVLTVTARPSEKDDKAEYLYRGIAGRAFEKRFNLADYVEVEGASFEDGLLHIDLVRRVPEAMKPRRIEVGVKKTPDERRQRQDHRTREGGLKEAARC